MYLKNVKSLAYATFPLVIINFIHLHGLYETMMWHASLKVNTLKSHNQKALNRFKFISGLVSKSKSKVAKGTETRVPETLLILQLLSSAENNHSKHFIRLFTVSSSNVHRSKSKIVPSILKRPDCSIILTTFLRMLGSERLESFS